MLFLVLFRFVLSRVGVFACVVVASNATHDRLATTTWLFMTPLFQLMVPHSMEEFVAVWL